MGSLLQGTVASQATVVCPGTFLSNLLSACRGDNRHRFVGSCCCSTAAGGACEGDKRLHWAPGGASLMLHTGVWIH